MSLLQIAGTLLGVARFPAERDPAAVGLGIAVRWHRTNRGWSEEALAYRAGLQPEAVTAIEAGEGHPTLAFMFQLAAGLEIPGSELVRTIEELGK
jgi:transcriptional regulator with XRE-family HTH domain